MKDDTTNKSNRYRIIYNSYGNDIIYVTTSNIKIKYYERKTYNKIDKIILKIKYTAVNYKRRYLMV